MLAIVLLRPRRMFAVGTTSAPVRAFAVAVRMLVRVLMRQI
jgi:hypothetical protein